ncbi:MAG: hypothetical protein RR739_03540, partial [Clostridia bacterium]
RRAGGLGSFAEKRNGLGKGVGSQVFKNKMTQRTPPNQRETAALFCACVLLMDERPARSCAYALAALKLLDRVKNPLSH